MARGSKPFALRRFIRRSTVCVGAGHSVFPLPDLSDLQDSEDEVKELSHDIVVDDHGTSCSMFASDTQIVTSSFYDGGGDELKQDSILLCVNQYVLEQLPDGQHEFDQPPGDQLEFGQLPDDQYEIGRLPDGQHELDQPPGDQLEFDQLFDDAASSDLYGFISDQCYQGPFF